LGVLSGRSHFVGNVAFKENSVRPAREQLYAVAAPEQPVEITIGELTALIENTTGRMGAGWLQELIDNAIAQMKKPYVPPKSILQDWVTKLGLRHQGVLLGAIRGCDGALRGDVSKPVVRCLRAAILHAHCGDVTRAATFMEWVPRAELQARLRVFRRNMDHLPVHFVMHLVQAVEVIGYKHPEADIQGEWYGFYRELCRKLHLNPESEHELDDRLNADEQTFQRLDRA